MWHGSVVGCREKDAAAVLNEELSRRGRIWLICAGAALLSYVLFSGQVLHISFGPEDPEADEK